MCIYKLLIFNVWSFLKKFTVARNYTNTNKKLKPASVSHQSGTSRLEDLVALPYSI